MLLFDMAVCSWKGAVVGSWLEAPAVERLEVLCSDMLVGAASPAQAHKSVSMMGGILCELFY